MISRFGPRVGKLDYHCRGDPSLQVVGEDEPGIPTQEPDIPAIVFLC